MQRIPHQCRYNGDDSCRTCRVRCSFCSRCRCQEDRRVGALVQEARKMALTWCRGRAVGGPRDGVIVEASAAWDGVVGANAGRYTWDDEVSAWVWRPSRVPVSRRYVRKKDWKAE